VGLIFFTGANEEDKFILQGICYSEWQTLKDEHSNAHIKIFRYRST
jgi:hypothetical protein